MTTDEIIELALKEDIGPGDITCKAIFREKKTGKARLLVKEQGILAGIPVVEKVFQHVDPTLEVEFFKKDGDSIMEDDIVFEVNGNLVSILTSERVVLNFLQRLSGIATLTHQVVKQLKGLPVKVLDTRKTTPNLRELEKYAVVAGGGYNHRMGLYDMIMIKDNHIDTAGGIMEAIEAVNKYLSQNEIKDIKIEIEVRNFEELIEVLEYGKVDRIMLDNFTTEDLSDAVKLVKHQFETEASGGITLANVRKYGETGVDFISMGALTHNYKSLDLSLKVVTKSVWPIEK